MYEDNLVSEILHYRYIGGLTHSVGLRLDLLKRFFMKKLFQLTILRNGRQVKTQIYDEKKKRENHTNNNS